jgi:hypothetical protein
MRRLVAALVLVTLAFALAACGGGEQTGGDAVVVTNPGTQPPATGDADAATVTDRSQNEVSEPPVPFPSFASTDTPAALQDKLDAGRAMIILFYDPAQESTDDVRAEVDAVMQTYRGLIDLVTYNTGGDPTSQAAQSSAVYAAELGVESTPYIIVVDESGYITYRWKGFVDRGIITREVERATQ